MQRIRKLVWKLALWQLCAGLGREKWRTDFQFNGITLFRELKCVITMFKTWVKMIKSLLCLRINRSSQSWLIQQKHFMGEFFMSEVVRAFAGCAKIAAEIVWELWRVDFIDNGIL